MWRELAEILMAINLSTHSVPQAREQVLATYLQDRAQDADVDPFIMVAIITHESQWREGAVSGDGEDFGLMQVRGKYYYGGHHNNWLFDGINNIRYGAWIIKRDKEICTNFLGREAKTQEWLACYAGSCTNGGMCKPTKLTKKIEDYSLCIQANVETEHSYNCKAIYWPELKTADDETYEQ